MKARIAILGFFLWAGHVLPRPPVMSSLELFSDRTLYIAGEDVHFAVYATDIPDDEANLYVEIVTPEGSALARNKWLLTKGYASGCLALPEHLISGFYYLKAYTAALRQQGPASYAWLCIKVVNPYREEFMSGDAPALSRANRMEMDASAELHVTPISVPNDSLGQSHGFLLKDVAALSVDPLIVSILPAPEALFQPMETIMANPVQIPRAPIIPRAGIVLTGMVMDDHRQYAEPNARVNLSILGPGQDFMAMQTDSAGRFAFTLPPYTGDRDLFLCAEKDTLTGLKVLVDNDYCTIPVGPGSPEFILTSAEREAALDMARHRQLQKYFSKEKLPCRSLHEITQKAFYGEPDATLKFDQYIELPTLEEYFDELPTPVKIKKRQGRKYFKVIGPREEMIYFDPLVLVDWVAVRQPEKILSATPASIDRIEVVTSPYVKGNITYGGIVSIVSKRGDFGGIDLPASGVFLRYQFLADSCACLLPAAADPNGPDVKNTWYWNPHLPSPKSDPDQILLPLRLAPGEYGMILQGLFPDKRRFFQVVQFSVPEKK